MAAMIDRRNHAHFRHPRENGDPVITRVAAEYWVPACAGMTAEAGTTPEAGITQRAFSRRRAARSSASGCIARAACSFEIPAQAGIQFVNESASGWIPACAGISEMEWV